MSNPAEHHPGRWSPPIDLDQAREALEAWVGKGYILPGVYGSLSIKSRQPDLYGETEQVLWMVHPHERGLEKAGETQALRTDRLQRVFFLEELALPELEHELHLARRSARDPIPAWESLLHAAFPERCVSHTCPPALLAIASSSEWKKYLAVLSGPVLGNLEFAPPGWQVARQLAHILVAPSQTFQAVYLMGYGLLASGPSVEDCVQVVEDLERTALEYLERQGSGDIRVPQRFVTLKPSGKRLASLRQEISQRLGAPVILNQDQASPVEDLISRLKQEPEFLVTPPTVYHARSSGWSQFYILDESHLEETGLKLDENLRTSFPPMVLLGSELGACSAGFTAGQAFQSASAFSSTIQAWRRAESLGSYHGLPSTGWVGVGSLPSRGEERQGATPFCGEIALVTGGASGIGKACVDSLLKRGAAVASLDINPSVVELYDKPDYLGLCCDLTDEEAVLKAFEAHVLRFGGLDMLVLNAGIFPPGIRIESLDLAHWQKVMRINLDSNLVVLREAHPLLQASPRGGRVLVNASKNVLAPGAGAAAYSSAKAAVTQLARVAALEWGKDRIRVNMIHPDAVFDTGIWTEEVLQARAAHYGLSVQQYKTRNLLGVELNSSYIGELAAEMLGPLFEKITGAQIPVDGGSDRVI